MLMNRIAVFLLAGLLLVITVHVDAYRLHVTPTGQRVKWPVNEVVFHIVTKDLPTEFHQPLINAMNTWNGAPADFVFRNGGTTTQSNYEDLDQVNLIGFAPLPENQVGLAFYWYDAITGNIVDTDIRLNSVHPWSTNGAPDAFDVESIALHELGHALHLGDLYDSAKADRVMYGYTSHGKVKRSLHQGDKNGIASLYGQAVHGQSSSSGGGGGGCTLAYRN
jgi:hypothetical protein